MYISRSRREEMEIIKLILNCFMVLFFLKSQSHITVPDLQNNWEKYILLLPENKNYLVDQCPVLTKITGSDNL